MSEPLPNRGVSTGSVATLPEPSSNFPIHRSWKIATVVASIMVVLALLGIGITTASPPAAYVYWVSLVPIYGLLCVATARARSKTAGGAYHYSLMLKQFWHWLGIGVALGFDFYIRGSGEMSLLGAGLNALLLLALGCYLAGVHLAWQFTVVGGLLTLALMVVVKAEQYVWLIIVVGVLAVALMVTVNRLLAQGRQNQVPTITPPVPPVRNV